jgi:hypothetical protein
MRAPVETEATRQFHGTSLDGVTALIEFVERGDGPDRNWLQ